VPVIVVTALLGAALAVIALPSAATATATVTSAVAPTPTSSQPVLPDWAIGPFTRYGSQPGAAQGGNPVLAPQGTGFEAGDTFNPGVVYRDGKFQMLYRAQASDGISTVGYAYSTDGHHFTRYPGNPVIQQDGSATESSGIDDPRLYELNGTYYTFVSGYNFAVTPPQTIVEYTSTDLVNWHEVGAVVHTNYDPAVVTNGNDTPVLLSTPYGPRYVMYYGDSDPAKGRFVAYSTNMTTWTDNTPLNMQFPANYDPWEICVTVTDYQTTQNGPVNHNILMFVAGTMMAQGRWYYAISEVEFSGSNLGQQLDQLTFPIVQPTTSYELLGQTQRTMFMNSIMFHNGQWWMYYGAGDTVVALANAPLRSQASASAYQNFTGTSFEPGQRAPDWASEVDTAPGGGGISGVGAPAGSGLSGPESMVTYQQTAHTGDAALSFSGTAQGSAQDYAYMKVFDLSSAPVAVDKYSTLSYWIFPDSSTSDGAVNGDNSTCEALDLVFSDGTALRNLGARDQNGNPATPAGQCGHLTLDQWNHVNLNIGSVANGRDISSIDVGYDQPNSSGGFHGYIDDVSLSPGYASISAPGTAAPTSDVTIKATFVNPGPSAVSGARFTLFAPSGWSVRAQSPLPPATLNPGQSVQVSWSADIPASAQESTATLTAQLTGQGLAHQLSASSTVSVGALASGGLSPAVLVLPAGSTVTADLDLTSNATSALNVGYQATAPSGVSVTPASGTASVSGGGSATVSLTVSVPAGTPLGSYEVPITVAATDHGTTYPLTTLRLQVSVPYSNLAAAFNNTGISDDSNPGNASFDGGPDSYSAEGLAAAGLTLGGQVTADGLTFTWPNVAAGQPDNVTGNGQAISLPGVGTGTVLGFLGAADSGPQSGPVTVTYTDGTTQTSQLGFSDWTLGAGSQSPSFGNQIVATLPYRNTAGGQDNTKTYVFLAEIQLAAGKSVSSITLPTGEGKLHVFAVAAGTPTG
jgi:predicted GH43/DUF377 family glycosyl hydrolase